MGTGLNSRKTRSALRTSASISLQLLLVLLGGWVAWRMLGGAWSVIWPVVIALLLTTLTWPPVRFLRKHRWPPALAAGLVTLLFLVVAIGTFIGIAAPVAAKAPELADQVSAGIRELQSWAAGPPLNISNEDITGYLDTATQKLQASVGSIATATLSGVSSVFNGLINTVLALFLMFFFLKDGPRFLPWLSRQVPGRLATDLPTVAGRCWEVLGSFVRSQALVGLLDAVLIGIGLAVLGVDLALPLAVLTFVTAFVPIVGALFAGFVAVVITFVTDGWTDALIVLAIIIVVQQLEGNVFQPMVQSRGLGLHAGVVLLAVTLGSSLYGIVGALLAVPVAAMIAVLWIYLREQLSDSPPASPSAPPGPDAPPPPSSTPPTSVPAPAASTPPPDPAPAVS
ncbi:AI-2E family transporter [Actinoplanes philippinensis]|uniref:Predicted PurR-regulated permease PerM n=1 Tax=Actinoplanes philippinensis TaxID=35752 RepID=A0A1I2MG97_9ACTN|nr:AI-2E family transporter [Actinoplanes philippinensis]GIE83139.1 AI-2E family transporter [Actinoplanes philippinensis]SFF90535.1 Predicted PurR-regulated permease PerM [Actinoplanes philippinensis]